MRNGSSRIVEVSARDFADGIERCVDAVIRMPVLSVLMPGGKLRFERLNGAMHFPFRKVAHRWSPPSLQFGSGLHFTRKYYRVVDDCRKQALSQFGLFIVPPPRATRNSNGKHGARYWQVTLGKFTADALCRHAWRPPCSPMGRLASPSAPAPPWSSSAIVRTSRSTSRSKSPRSACQSLRAANRPATRNERNTSPCRASSPPP